MDDILDIARTFKQEHLDYETHWDGCESQHVECLVIKLADEIEKQLKAIGTRHAHGEGYQNSEWILIDYNDLVVHIFSKTARAYYDLERLWRDGKRLDVSKFLQVSETKPAPRKTRKIL